MSDQKNIAQISAELAQHVLELELRMGVDQVLLSYVVVDLAAKGMMSQSLIESFRNVPIPGGLHAEDAARFTKLLHERADALSASAAKLAPNKG